MPIMNKLTASYIAGIIDGEGSIGLQKNKKSECVNGINYVPRLRIGMIDKEFIEWLKNSFGGWIYHRKQNGNNKDSYTWQVEGKVMKEIIKKVYPYLRIKKKHAEIIMKFWKTKEYVVIPKSHKELKPEIRVMRDNLYQQLIKIQIKGKNVAAEETERENP